MVIKNTIYIVYGQDVEGRDVSPHYFLDKCDACKYAIVSKGKLAYGMPTVCTVTIVYNTDNISLNKYTQSVHVLSQSEIQRYADGDN